ncbi:MAG TPA: PEP-CTERM sorting domain-containing protein [Bryobacteraceae bacterium]|jgi:hypothetical protein|nr:PEP-CTERM sorting domain-containing protein [Bryobacteraceae bacterium]
MRFLTCSFIGMALLSVHGKATTISYVSVYADAAAGGITNGYDSVAGLATHGGGANQTWTFTSTPSTNILGLASANVSTVFTSFDPQNGSTANDASSASANLATGILGASAGGFCSGTGFPANACGLAESLAEMQDMLNFTNTTGQTQNITITWAFDGSAGSSLDGLDFLFCFGATTSCLGNASGAGPHSPVNAGQIFTFTENCIDGNCGDPNPTTTLPTSGWVSTSVTGANTTTETFTGIFAVPAGMSTDSLNAWLEVSCGDGDSCDFSHTATLNISSINGVSYTSSSGVLLTQSGVAPEPSSWAMMLIGGLGIAAGIVRRRL